MLYPIQYSLVNTVCRTRFTSEYCIPHCIPMHMCTQICIKKKMYTTRYHPPSLLCLALAKYYNFARSFAVFCLQSCTGRVSYVLPPYIWVDVPSIGYFLQSNSCVVLMMSVSYSELLSNIFLQKGKHAHCTYLALPQACLLIPHSTKTRSAETPILRCHRLFRTVETPIKRCHRILQRTIGGYYIR